MSTHNPFVRVAPHVQTNAHNLPDMSTRAINAVLKGFDEIYMYEGALVLKVLKARRVKGVLQFHVTVDDRVFGNTDDKPFWHSGCEAAGWAIIAWNVERDWMTPIVNVYRRLPNSVLKSIATDINAVANFLRGSEGGAS